MNMSVLLEYREAIALHQKKDDDSYEEQISLPLAERIAKGITMAGLKVKFAFFDEAPNKWCPHLSLPYKFIKRAHVHSEYNISKFREGAIVVLSNGRLSFRMEVKVDNVEEFVLAPNDFDVKECYLDSNSYDETGWEINIVKSDLTLELLSATAGNLENDPPRLSKIEKLFHGSMSNERTPFEYNALNDSQNQAIQAAVGASDFHLIQGPPGTGKTTTIAHLAMTLLNQGMSVFVTAPTHTAINNCLNAVASLVNDESRVIKIGEKYQASEIAPYSAIKTKTRYPYFEHSLMNQSPDAGIVIGGTPYSMCYPASMRLHNWEFDVALIDEAAQMSIPEAIAVMSKTNKFIFVGDHKQLDPIIPKGTGSAMFSESIFQRLAHLYPENVSLLSTSYRLCEGLIRIPNALFYNGYLRAFQNKGSNRLEVKSDRFSEIWSNPDPSVLFLHHEFDAQGRSPHEAQLVAELVADLRAAGVASSQIGILTPYRAQVREVKRALVSRMRSSDSDGIETFFVDTVERMQGQEKDFIIYSMSNSHPLESRQRLDFFYSPNRLNVAITRARVKCVVIANYKVFDLIDEELVEIPNYSELKPSLDLFKQYRRLSTVVVEPKREEGW